MSIRTTLALVIVGVVVGIVVYINPFKEAEEAKAKPPWFYQVSEDDIEVIEVLHQGNQVRFVRGGKRAWEFEDHPGVSPQHKRWGGMVLMLTGPRTRRLLLDNPGELAEYGLDNPETVVDVTLSGDRRIQVSLGDQTTDGKHHYGRIAGFEELFLIVTGWGRQLSRLATDRPYPKWFRDRSAEEITELSIIKGKYHGGDGSWLQFKLIEDDWVIQLHGTDRWRTPVDEEGFAEIIPLLRGPEFEVEDAHVDDFAPYGIFEKSTAIHLKFEGISDKGTEFEDSLIFRVGEKNEDGSRYYGRTEEGEFQQPLLLLEADWIDRMLELYDNVPYGQIPRRGADQIAERSTYLIEEVSLLGLPEGQQTLLNSRLEAARQSLTDGDADVAKDRFLAFIDQVNAERGKTLTDDQADRLIAEVERFIDSLYLETSV